MNRYVTHCGCKPAALILLMLLPASAALAAPQMSDEQMQQMMQNAQQMQDCMSQVDEGAMQAFEDRAEQMDKDIKALCAAGKRDEAQAKAMAYGKEMAASSTMKAMKQCGDMAMKMMSPAATAVTGASASHHVCDDQ